MAKLVLYSDQIYEDRKVDKWLRKFLNKMNPSIGYIPSCSDLTRTYYNQRVDYYKTMGVQKVDYFDLDQEYDPATIMDVFTYDAIHLSGGNTFYFLESIKKRGFIKHLCSYVRNGGILIGISAGSIITAKTIDISGFGDKNIVGSTDTSALGLVDFEFCPHWDGGNESLEQIRAYARPRNATVYAVKDGDGIIVDGDQIQIVGDVVKVE